MGLPPTAGPRERLRCGRRRRRLSRCILYVDARARVIYTYNDVHDGGVYNTVIRHGAV